MWIDTRCPACGQALTRAVYRNPSAPLPPGFQQMPGSPLEPDAATVLEEVRTAWTCPRCGWKGLEVTKWHTSYGTTFH